MLRKSAWGYANGRKHIQRLNADRRMQKAKEQARAWLRKSINGPLFPKP